MTHLFLFLYRILRRTIWNAERWHLEWEKKKDLIECKYAVIWVDFSGLLLNIPRNNITKRVETDKAVRKFTDE